MKSDKLALAHRMIEAADSPLWRETILPYLERERLLQIEMMASMTDALQLMRYAGAVQAIGSLIDMKVRAEQLVRAEQNKILT